MVGNRLQKETLRTNIGYPLRSQDKSDKVENKSWGPSPAPSQKQSWLTRKWRPSSPKNQGALLAGASRGRGLQLCGGRPKALGDLLPVALYRGAGSAATGGGGASGCLQWGSITFGGGHRPGHPHINKQGFTPFFGWEGCPLLK